MKFAVLLVLTLTGGFVYCKEQDCKNKLDIVAVLDGSGSIDAKDFTKLKNAAIQMVRDLNLGPNAQQFGALVFSSSVTNVIQLTSNQKSLISIISKIGQPRGGTATHLGIQEMKKMFDNKSRKGARKIGIVITDGQSNSQPDTVAAARKAQSSGIIMFAVGVGSNVDDNELKAIGGSSSNVLHLANFDALKSKFKELMKKICVVPVNGAWSAWSSHSKSHCSVTCGSGVVTVAQTRTCTNPAPKHGGKACPGNGIKSYTEPCHEKPCPFCEGCSCDGCHYQNGAGFLPHPTDCRFFLHCIEHDPKFHIRECPQGLYWSQKHLTCTSPSSVKCVTTATAAPLTPDTVTELPGAAPPLSGCDGTKKVVKGNIRLYQEQVPGHGWKERECPLGTVYNSSSCSCEHGQSAKQEKCDEELYLPFNDDLRDHSRHKVYVEAQNVQITKSHDASFAHMHAMARIQRFSNVDFGKNLRITFQMYKGPKTSRDQAIVSNAECDKTGSIYIIQKGSAIEFRVANDEGALSTLLVPLNKSNAFVSLTIHNEIMTAEVNNVRKEASFKGRIGKVHCGLQIGRATNYDHFNGRLKEFKLFMCM